MGIIAEPHRSKLYTRVKHLLGAPIRSVELEDEMLDSLLELSIGDYVLSGGEIPAVVFIDAVVRLLPGVLGDIDSAFTDSFNDYLLDCDYYTRPEIFEGIAVPEILLSGDHKKIEAWRLKQRENITQKQRPDLYKKYKEK